MATKTQPIPSTEAHKYYKEHWQARRKALGEGASWAILANLAALEHEAWCNYVKALRRECNDKSKFVIPERPL